MPLHAIAYVSRAREDLADTELDELLADATAFNRVAGVTGVLLFDGVRFLQYLEGPRDGLESVHARVLNATRHHLMRELAAGPLRSRWFPCWTMASRRVDVAVLSDIVAAPWHGFDMDNAMSDQGFGMLLRTWTDGRGALEPAAVCLGS